MSSSLRNAVKRITHKERSQPTARQHLGFLEKKQDYKKRAVNFHRKEDRLRAMQRKATMRNPDEFYMGMHNAQINADTGQHQQTEAAMQKELSDQIGAEAVRVMKDQDLTYVRMQKQKDSKKAQRLKESLHLIGAANQINQSSKKQSSSSSSSRTSKHTIFVESKDEADAFDPAEHFDTAPELVDRAFNRLRKSKLRKLALEQLGYDDEGDVLEDHDDQQQKVTKLDLERQEKMARKAAKSAARARSNAYGELEARTKRAAIMELAEAHLTTDKLLQGKGRKRKIKAAEHGKPAQYQWRRKRKR